MNFRIGILIYLLILPVSACNLGVILETDQSQKIDVEVPLIATIQATDLFQFLAIDRISVEKMMR